MFRSMAPMMTTNMRPTSTTNADTSEAGRRSMSSIKDDGGAAWIWGGEVWLRFRLSHL